MVIIGAGPSGIAAASLLMKAALKILVIDENPQIGGQLWRKTLQTPSGMLSPSSRPLQNFKRSYRNTGPDGNVSTLTHTSILGIFLDKHILLSGNKGGCRQIEARFIIFATGAREKVIPFKGWTLPGVMTLGAVQILLKSHGILASQKMLLSGTGPLLYLLGAQIAGSGGRVEAILEQRAILSQLPLARHMSWSKLLQAMQAFYHLIKKRVCLSPLEMVVEVNGKTILEQVVTAKIKPDGDIIPDSYKTYKTNLLVCGNGFTPNIELPQLAGCGLHYRTEKGGWVVKVDHKMQTSVSDIYAVGEITGVSGGEKGIVEGRIAALAILEKLDNSAIDNIENRRSVLLKQRDRLQRFGSVLNRLWQPHKNYFQTLPDETIICRCQDISMGTIRNWIKEGFHSLHALKKATRCGMGNCQGRTCGPIIHHILTFCTKDTVVDPEPFSVRTPVKPITIGDLSQLQS